MNHVIPTSSTAVDNAFLQMIGGALDAALMRARQPESRADIDVAQAPYVIFSDRHKSARSRADDFRASERASWAPRMGASD